MNDWCSESGYGPEVGEPRSSPVLDLAFSDSLAMKYKLYILHCTDNAENWRFQALF